MNEKKSVQVYFGNGQGKTTAAIGQCIRAISMDEQVIVIQFLKGKEQETLRCLDQFDDNIKVFRFEKFQQFYQELSREDQQEERQNLLNGFHYAKKVAEIGECDLLVLDEVLGLVDLGIITVEELANLVNICKESCRLVMTGLNLPNEILSLVDTASRIDAVK